MPFPQATSACCSEAASDQSVLKNIDEQSRSNSLPKVDSTSELVETVQPSMPRGGVEFTMRDWARLREELTNSLQNILSEWSNQQATLLSKALEDLTSQAASNAASCTEGLPARRNRRLGTGRRLLKPLVIVDDQETADDNEENQAAVSPASCAESVPVRRSRRLGTGSRLPKPLVAVEEDKGATDDDEEKRFRILEWSERPESPSAGKVLDRGDSFYSFSAEKPPTPMARSPSGETILSGMERWLPSLPAWMMSRANSQGYYRGKLWAFLEDPESSRCATIYANCIQIFILMTVAFSLLQQTAESMMLRWHAEMLEAIIDGCFTVDLLLRFCVCPNRLKFLCNPYNLIDVLAAAPLYVQIFLSFRNSRTSLSNVRIEAFVPILRLLRTLRRFKEFHLLSAAFQRSLEALPVLLFFYCVLILFFGALVHAVEPLGNVKSLSHALWLTVVSMTTVGYGDVYPITAQGRIVVVVLVLTSALYMAVPLGIIGNCFSEVWRDRERILLLHVLRTRFSQWGYSPYDIPLMFAHFDKDKDGDLDFQEFRALLDALRIGMREDKIVKLFDELSEMAGTVDSAIFVKSLFPSLFHEMYDKDGQLVSPKEEVSWFNMVSTFSSTKTSTGPEQPALATAAKPSAPAIHE